MKTKLSFLKQQKMKPVQIHTQKVQGTSYTTLITKMSFIHTVIIFFKRMAVINFQVISKF